MGSKGKTTLLNPEKIISGKKKTFPGFEFLF